MPWSTAPFSDHWILPFILHFHFCINQFLCAAPFHRQLCISFNISISWHHIKSKYSPPRLMRSRCVPISSKNMSLPRSTVKRGLHGMTGAGLVEKAPRYRENGSHTSNRLILKLAATRKKPQLPLRWELQLLLEPRLVSW